jgi:hypothetical protein
MTFFPKKQKRQFQHLRKLFLCQFRAQRSVFKAWLRKIERNAGKRLGIKSSVLLDAELKKWSELGVARNRATELHVFRKKNQKFFSYTGYYIISIAIKVADNFDRQFFQQSFEPMKKCSRKFLHTHFDVMMTSSKCLKLLKFSQRLSLF